MKSKMKNKKKALLGVAFIASIIALAGVGYAVTHPGYTAQTASANGDYDVDYIILTLNTTAYTSPTNLKLTWNEVTTYDSGYITTFTFQDSTKLDHELTLTKAAGSDTDTFLLTATTSFSVSGYKLQYSTDGGTNWADYTGSALAGAGVSITAGTPTTYSWHVVPETTVVTADPLTEVSIPAITYLVTATQA